MTETHTCVANLLCDIGPDVRKIPHGQEAVKARTLLCFLDGRVQERLTITSDHILCTLAVIQVIQAYLHIWLIGEGVVVSNGRKKHLYADDEVLYQS